MAYLEKHGMPMPMHVWTFDSHEVYGLTLQFPALDSITYLSLLPFEMSWTKLISSNI